MPEDLKRKYFRLIFRNALRILSVCLVLSAVISAIYRDRLYFVYALCAFGALSILWGWCVYLRMSGSLIFKQKEEKERDRVPDFLKHEKDRKLHRASFLQDASDLHDDLTDMVSVDEEGFSEKETEKARMWSRLAAGVLLFLISFLV